MAPDSKTTDIQRYATDVLPKLWASVVPLCRVEDGDKAFLTGSGTLFKVADRHFLVTAYHVAREEVRCLHR